MGEPDAPLNVKLRFATNRVSNLITAHFSTPLRWQTRETLICHSRVGQGQADFSTPLSVTRQLKPLKVLFAFFFVYQQHADSSALAPAAKARATHMYERNTSDLNILLAVDTSMIPESIKTRNAKKIADLQGAIEKFKAKVDVPARAPRTVFSQLDIQRLIHARTFQDKHYDQKLNPAKTKVDLIAYSYNNGLDASSVSTAAGAVFSALDSTQHKTAYQLSNKRDSTVSEFRKILTDSQEDSITKAVAVRTQSHGEKLDMDAATTAVHEGLDRAKTKFGFVLLKL